MPALKIDDRLAILDRRWVNRGIAPADGMADVAVNWTGNQEGERAMGLYDALSAEDLAEGMASAPDTRKGVPTHAKMLNTMLIEGTTWRKIDGFLRIATTKQFSRGWPAIKEHLRFCRQGKNNGKTNTWVFNVGDETDEFCDRRDPLAVIRLVGFSNGTRL